MEAFAAGSEAPSGVMVMSAKAIRLPSLVIRTSTSPSAPTTGRGKLVGCWTVVIGP
ncbi:hypothetical protein [Streptomyces sp. ICC1]|uniref:hypothetical protein n=1 Tax=Streptomyces sp. ICC1 TaxID=2099583 RepID=UPI0013A6CC01|nr:hypothetical protein [Streptomyces sp. ICC1]